MRFSVFGAFFSPISRAVLWRSYTTNLLAPPIWHRCSNDLFAARSVPLLSLYFLGLSVKTMIQNCFYVKLIVSNSQQQPFSSHVVGWEQGFFDSDSSDAARLRSGPHPKSCTVLYCTVRCSQRCRVSTKPREGFPRDRPGRFVGCVSIASIVSEARHSIRQSPPPNFWKWVRACDCHRWTVWHCCLPRRL